jgi:SOS-response transcriptional repressor LexA
MLTTFVEKRYTTPINNKEYIMHDIQKKIIALAKAENIAELGYRKLGEKIGVDHPQKVKHHLSKLLNDGHLVRSNDGNIKVSAPGDMTGKMLNLPILGLANCGEALSYADNTTHGYLQLSPTLVSTKNSKNLFVVQATGDSMNKASIGGQTIDDGDYVVVDSSVTVPNNGDYVVSSIEGLANIKRYKRDESQQVIALVSESTKARPPIMVHAADEESYRIHGRVVQVMKQF